MQSFGVFLAYYINNDVFPGATPLDYAFIGGPSFSVAHAHGTRRHQDLPAIST
jgi:hypothetical protein